MIIGISFVQLVTFKLAQFISLILVYVKVAEYLNALLLKGHIPNALGVVQCWPEWTQTVSSSLCFCLTPFLANGSNVQLKPIKWWNFTVSELLWQKMSKENITNKRLELAIIAQGCQWEYQAPAGQWEVAWNHEAPRGGPPNVVLLLTTSLLQFKTLFLGFQMIGWVPYLFTVHINFLTTVAFVL